MAIWGTGTNENVLAGNYIGTDVTGTVALGNNWDGVRISGGARWNRIGANGGALDNDAERNLISGNARGGVLIWGEGTDNNVVAGNYIGTDVSGSAPLGNSSDGLGIYGAKSNRIGGTIDLGNTIAFNSGAGVGVVGSAAIENRIQANAIHSNVGLGIDLNLNGVTLNDPGDTDSGPNNLQNYPLIAAATFDGANTSVTGTLDSTPGTTFIIDLYGNTAADPSGFGEGEICLGTTTCVTDGVGNGTWTLVVAGDVTDLVLSSTATDPAGNTSEFSGNTPPVADAGPDQALDQPAVDEEVLVTLDGSGSHDPDGDPIVDYVWTGPFPEGGGTVHGVNPTVKLPVGTSTVSLVVNDGYADSDPDTVDITINRAVWYVDDDAPSDPGPNDNTVSDPAEDGSPEHPFDRVQEGIDAAADAHTVLVAAGTYNENLTWDTKSLDLLGAGAAETIVDAGGSGRCLTMTNVPDTTSVEGFTFTGGYESQGGGLHLTDSSPTLMGNTVTGNTAERGGGGIYLRYSSSALSNNIITDNSAGGDGGGLHLSHSSPALTDNVITGNSAYMGGGGLRLGSSSPTLTGNDISDNFGGPWGGGLKVGYYSSPTLTDNTIAGNTSSKYGGGLHISHYSCPTLMGNTIEYNSASEVGGGLWVGNASPTLMRNTIRENSASEVGGGLYMWDSTSLLIQNSILANFCGGSGGGVALSSSSPQMIENVISGNSTEGGGGGLNLYYSSPVLTGNTITGNSAAGGGGLNATHSSPVLTENTIAGNSASAWGGGGLKLSHSSPTLTANTITDNTAVNYGGGLFIHDESCPTLTQNTISDNTAEIGGGGVRLSRASGTLTNNIIEGNFAGTRGGGVNVSLSSATLTGNIIAHNTAPAISGVMLWSSSAAIANNTIVGNVHTEPAVRGPASVCLALSSGTLVNNTIHSNLGNGILCYGSSPTIESNSVNGNTASGIRVIVHYESGGDPGQAGLDVLSEPHIVGNTISNNGQWGIQCEDTAPSNAATLEIDNTLGTNGSGQVLQTWYGLVKVVNYDYSPAEGASVSVFNNDGDTSPDYGPPFVTSALGFAPDTSDLTDPTTWPAFTEFEVGNDGVRSYLTPQTVDASLGAAIGTATHSWNGRYQIVEVRLNTPPEISSFVNLSPFCAVAEGEEITVSGAFTDAGTLDTHTATVDWSDGSDPEELTVVGSGGSYTVEGSHAYQFGGVYTVRLTVEDDDLGVDDAECTAVITGAGVNNGVLQIVGTRDDDHVTVNRQGNGLFKVHANFLPDKGGWRAFDTDGIDLIYIVLCHGDDHATIAGNIQTPAIVDGGPGDDHLNGGGGSNVLLGGPGDDMLIGGRARDVLIGGFGSDRLVGNGEDDILIGGKTVYDSNADTGTLANDAALLSILEEWNSEDDFLTRQMALAGLLNSSTVEDDEEEDTLTGSSGEDWFFAGLGDVITDQGSKGNGKGKSGK